MHIDTTMGLRRISTPRNTDTEQKRGQAEPERSRRPRSSTSTWITSPREALRCSSMGSFATDGLDIRTGCAGSGTQRPPPPRAGAAGISLKGHQRRGEELPSDGLHIAGGVDQTEVALVKGNVIRVRACPIC